MTEMTIDYVKVSQHLKQLYECDRILMDFLELEGKIVIHKYYLHPDGSGRWGFGGYASYKYSDFEYTTKRIENGVEFEYPVMKKDD